MAAEFFNEDPTTIEKRLIAAFDSASGDLFPDHRIPGTPGYNLRNLWSRLLVQHHRELNGAYSSMSPRTADHAALDEWGKFFGMLRKERKSANGVVLISSEVTGNVLDQLVGTREIPAGTRLISGPAVLRTTEAATILEGSRSVLVSVQADGVFGSVAAEVGTRFSVELTNGLRDFLTAEVTLTVDGGQEPETDSQLRYRLVNALTSPSTVDGFLVRLLGHTSVSDAEISDNTYGPGTIEAYVLPALSFPPDSLRRDLEALWKGPGRAYVVFPTYESLVLRIRASGVVLTKTVVDYINNLAPGQTFVLSALENALSQQGGGDVQVLGIKRGPIKSDGTFGAMRTLKQITNQAPSSPRSKWYAQEDWVTLCS